MDSLLSFDGGLTLLAPIVAIVGALVTRKVVPALGAGVVVGSLVATQGGGLGSSGCHRALLSGGAWLFRVCGRFRWRGRGAWWLLEFLFRSSDYRRLFAVSSGDGRRDECLWRYPCSSDAY